MNIVIINLTRFGDLLQLQPTILGLESKGHNVALICLQNFAAAAELLRGVNYILPLPGSDFLHDLDNDWRLALNSVESMLQKLEKDFEAHMIVNTTSTLGARLLAKRIATRTGEKLPILGFGLDDDGFGISGDIWSTFLQGASTERHNCPFNLVDIFRSVCDVADAPALWGLQQPRIKIQTESLKLLNKYSHPDAQGFVGFQLGASNIKRQWPVEYFSELGAKLWHEYKLCPVLLGSASEQGLANQYAQAVQKIPHPFVNVVGATDIMHLAGVLVHCKLLVTNDTGTMHLAAGLNIPTVAFFLATAQAWDTGPYMPNCCCLESALSCHPCAFHTPCVHGDKAQPCLHNIKSSDVFELIQHYLQYKVWPRYEQNEIRVWETAQESDGFASLKGLSGHEDEQRSHWLMIQRHFYRRILDSKYKAIGKLPDATRFTDELRHEVGNTLQQAISLLLLLEKQIMLMHHHPSVQNGERILINCNTLQSVLQESNYLKVLAHMWAILSQEHGGDLTSFSGLTQNLRSVLLEWQSALCVNGT